MENEVYKLCIKEHNITEETIRGIGEAKEPNSKHSCFFRCVLFKKGIVSTLDNFGWMQKMK